MLGRVLIGGSSFGPQALAGIPPASPPAAHPLNQSQGPHPLPGRFALHLPGTSPAQAQALAQRNQCRLVGQLATLGWYAVQCTSTTKPLAAAQHWQQQPGVAWIEPIYPLRLATTPNDLTPQQWHHHNTGQPIDGQPALAGADIDALDAWSLQTGQPGVMVAVLDTGITADHLDLQHRMAQNLGETDCTNGLDDDHNGYIDDCAGWDAGEGDNDPDPRTHDPSCTAGHGTWVAGLVGAEGNNGLGTVGVLWNTRILSVKISDDATCQANTFAAAEGIRYAVARGARVITVAWQVPYSTKLLEDAFALARDANTLVVMAAGNESTNQDHRTDYPIDYNHQNHLVVAATTPTDALAPFANWGPTQVHLGAPGQALLTTDSTAADAYTAVSGSSFAAGLVAGAAALVWSEYPGLTPLAVKAAITEGTDALAALDCDHTDRCVASGGRLNLRGALDVAADYATLPAHQPTPGQATGCQCHTSPRFGLAAWGPLFAVFLFNRRTA